MFQLNPSPTFKALVPLSRPGVEQPLPVAFEFRHKTKEAYATWREGLKGRSDVDALHDVIERWEGVVDDAGQPVPYSHAALFTLLTNFTPSAREIFAKYESELIEAKAKNS